MILPSDYDNAKAYDGSSFNALPVGGHICRIVGAREAKSRNGNDMIEIAFDIAENGPDDGRFKERFDNLRKSKPDAKWPNDGTFRTAILTKDGKTSGYFKGVITAVEESNPGYGFKDSGCNMDTMKGKLIGFNFGEEEWRKSDGSIGVSVKPFYAISVATVREGIQPPPRKALKENPTSMERKGFTQVQDDELPF